MSSYDPEWCKTPCPICRALPHKPCTAVFNLPKGTTLRLPHYGRLQAHEETKATSTATATSSLQPDSSNEPQTMGRNDVLQNGTASGPLV